MSLLNGPGEDWEQIVALARRIDHEVASRKGIDNGEVLRLARAVVAFQQRLAGGSVMTREVEPEGHVENGAHVEPDGHVEAGGNVEPGAHVEPDAHIEPDAHAVEPSSRS
ncbi:MAG TPA: hypothetical protein VE987_11030 [Polyangiaceae bacterium]|nr:hypothetical protein [Polyangiaceae bacterium]